MSIVDDTRRALGPVGAFLPAPYDVALSAAEQRAAARRLEAAGWSAVWLNEAVGGKDTMVQAAVLLAATDALTIGTGIANIWARPAVTLHGGAAAVADAFPGRFVLGIGVGYAHQAELVGQQFGPPAPTMRAYLDAMDTPTRLPAPDAPYARLLAANGPKLLELSRDRADGALPAMPSPERTAELRTLLGAEKLLVALVHLPADQADDAVAAGVNAQLEAGADHVVLTPDLGAPYGPSVDQFERLAAVLP